MLKYAFRLLLVTIFLLVFFIPFFPSVSTAESDVSSLVQVNISAPVYDYDNGQTLLSFSLTNTSSEAVPLPISLAITEITNPQVSLFSSPDGTTADNYPAFIISPFSGDINGDGSANDVDMNLFSVIFGLAQEPGKAPCTTGVPCQADFDVDGDVDAADLAFFSSHFGDAVDALAPGETSAARILRFSNPERLRFGFTTKVVTDNGQPTNQPPVANAGEDQTYTLPAGQTEMSVVLHGSTSFDPDGQIVSYQWSGTPDPEDVMQPEIILPAGTYTFTLVVTDDDGAVSDPDTVQIVVGSSTPVELHPPVITVDPQTVTVNEGGTVTVSVTASDLDGDVVSLAAAPKINNASFAATAGVAAGGTFTFTPDFSQQGIHVVAFTARDPLGATDTKTVQIMVNNINRPPELSVPAALEVDEGKLATVQLQASDPDGDPLTLTASPLPAGAIFIPATRTITFAPDFDQSGSYTITCTASDGEQQAVGDVTVTVNDVPTGGSGGASELVLNVDDPENPTLQATTRITGTVNTAGAPQPQRITASLITSLLPATARQGETLDVVLRGQTSGDFVTHFAAGASQADFGDGITVNSITVNSPTEAVANISITPDAAVGTRGATITTGSETAVSMLAFNVDRGRTNIVGVVLDPENSLPISNAVVNIEGTNLTTMTSSDGAFSFTDVASGTYYLIINPPNHAMMRMGVTAVAGSTLNVGQVESKSLVFDPTATPAVSLLSVLGRGASSLGKWKKRQDFKELTRDTMLLLGGDDEVGVLDAYGNQLHPEVSGNGVLSLSDEGADFIARKMQRNQVYSLADLLAGVSIVFEWGGDGVPLTLPEWLNDLQNLVNQAWADPMNPENYPLLIIFNHGNTLTPDPPELKPFFQLNALQAFLFTTGLYGAMEQVDPHAEMFLERSIHIALEFLVKTAYAGPATSAINRSKYNKYWRGFFDTKSSWPLTRFRQDASKFNFAVGFITAVSVSSASVLGPLTATMLYGTMIPDMTMVFSTAWTMAHLPEPPEIISAKLNQQTGRVEILYDASVSESQGYDWLYTLSYFDSPDSKPIFKGSFQLFSGFVGTLEKERLMFDEAPPENGSGMYAMTVTRQPKNSDELYGPLLPFWGLAHGDTVTDEYLWHIRTTRGVTSDWSAPYIYMADEMPQVGDLNALCLHQSGYSQFAYVSDSQNGVIWAHRLDSPSGEDESHATFHTWTGGQSFLGMTQTWHLDVGFAEPGQKGLAMDENENLYTENAASDALYGGRVFQFPLTGGKNFIGSINYFSRMLSFAHPTMAGPMDFGPEPEHVDDGLPKQLYVCDDLERSIKAIPVFETNDPYHRVGRVFIDTLGDHGPVIDMQWRGKRLYVLQHDRIVEVIRHENAVTGNWETTTISHDIFPDTDSTFMPGGLAVCPCMNNNSVQCENEERRFLVTDNTNGKVVQVKTSATGALVKSVPLITDLSHPGDIDLGNEGKIFALINDNSVRHYYTGLTGTVVDTEGHPLGGAIVTISGDMLDDIVTTTDPNGVFTVFDLTKPPRSDNTVVITIENNGQTIQKGLFLDSSCQTVTTIVFDPESERGIINVRIEPSEVLDQSHWFLGGGGAALTPGISLSLLPGNYIVSFQPIAGWNTPDDVIVAVEPGMTIEAQGIYTR